MTLNIKRYTLYFDWISFGAMLALASIGLLFVYSATHLPHQPYSLFFKKQLFGMLSGMGIYILFTCLDYRRLARIGYFAYLATMCLLLFTVISGSIAMGGRRWIQLGFFKFQPSELAKLFLPSFISYYLFIQNDSFIYTIKNFIPLLAIIGISFLLVAKQPDLGTALLVLGTGLIMCWLAGMPRKYFMFGILFIMVTAPISWKLLKPYQKQRIAVFLGQGQEQNERYQIEQSKIAIGSGGLFGKGLLKGTQNTLLFLPESRTDFIFAVVCEEWGLVGALLVLSLFALLFIRILSIIGNIKQPFTQLLGYGLLMPCILAAIINMAMVMGLLPAVGIPLPLMSYGITHIWITFAALGWLQSIAVRRSHLQ